MSLSSSELNYLVWRYLQESGHDLAAYALEKHSKCSSYEHNKNLDIIKRIEPGCLVELVQKGILYSLSERASKNVTKGSGQEEQEQESPLGSVLTFFGAVLSNESEKLERELIKENVNESAATTKSKQVGDDEDVDMVDADDTNVESSNKNGTSTSTNNNNNNNNKNEVKSESPSSSLPPHKFTTREISPSISFPESITSHWHPKSEVFAYGKEDSTAVIVALSDHSIAESVTLRHPTLTGDVLNEINIVSWAPAGNVIITNSINGELRAWSPDGKLKNIANTATLASDDELQPSASTMISSLLWSESGSFLLSIDINNHVCLWDGSNLQLVQQIAAEPLPGQSTATIIPTVACWLDDNRFALSTMKHGIKIFGISSSGSPGLSPYGVQQQNIPAKPLGLLSGHEHTISILQFNHISKLLASCSDFDYNIKIWQSNSLQHSLELNVEASEDYTLHAAPIVTLEWIDKYILLSVSMDGVVNIWNVKGGEAQILISANVSAAGPESFQYEGKTPEDTDEKELQSKGISIFNATVSLNRKWLVLGDDSGRVSVWDISLDHYPQGRSKWLYCVGEYKLADDVASTSERGICDITWSKRSNKVCVSYKGHDSIVFDWE
ncbi:SIR4-interacting protein Sif2p [[Candida] anglica]|uniref:SIR4-interacting protein Sif2p n=1 Tax=[Candida] anglica TaxID=148631 RepID=A0ABP0EML5_9ASCO